jgi:hypothetical protein
MGVLVEQWWWDKRKESITSKTGKLDERRVFDTDLVRLTLADISFSEFSLYWERLKPYPKGDEIWRKRRIADRMKFGWTVEDKPARNWPETLNHRYFQVRHRRI